MIDHGAQASKENQAIIEGNSKDKKKTKQEEPIKKPKRSKSASREKTKRKSKKKSSSLIIPEDVLKDEIAQVIGDMENVTIEKAVNLESRLEQELKKNSLLEKKIRTLQEQLIKSDSMSSLKKEQPNNNKTNKRVTIELDQEPDEIKSRIRKDSGKKLKSDQETYSHTVSYDVTQNIQSVRALLVTNQEIWDRCQGHVQKSKKEYHVSVTRYGFSTVKALKVQGGGNKIEFVTAPERSRKDIDAKSLLKLPQELTNIFEPIFQPGSESLLDFESYFEKSLMLHDDVLGPFLFHLKRHLESVQVCLGEIDSWLMGPAIVCNFIETTFGVELELPDEATVEKVAKLSKCNSINCRYPHFANDMCLNCGTTYKMHNLGTSSKCPFGRTTACFKHRPCQIITKYDAEDGAYDKDFIVEDEMDQAKLKKFVEFITL